MELSVGVIDTPAQKYLVVVGEASPEGFEAHRQATYQFMTEVRPI